MTALRPVAIHGTPRSGTSWLGEIINSSPHVAYRFQPLFSYAFKGYISRGSNAEQISQFFQKIQESNDDFLLQSEARRSGKLPTFAKASPTAIVYKEVRYHDILPNMLRANSDVKLVLIVRNPLSTIASWLNAPREFRTDLGWNRLEEWRYALKKNLNRPEEYNGFERWKEATTMFVHLASNYPDRVTLIRYEQLLQNPLEVAKQLLSFLDLPWSKQTEVFVRQSRCSEHSDSYAVFRANQTDNKWMTSLEQPIIDAVYRDLADTNLQIFLPKR